MVAHLLEKGGSANRVERIGEVQLDEHLVDVIAVAVHPLPRSVEANLTAKGLGDPNLERPQAAFGLILVSSTHDLTYQPAQGFSNRDRSS